MLPWQILGCQRWSGASWAIMLGSVYPQPSVLLAGFSSMMVAFIFPYQPRGRADARC